MAATSTLTVTEDNFNQVVDTHPILVLDFGATWCGPCRSFAPVFDAAATRHADLAFGKIDSDVEADLSKAFNIRSVPTLIIIREKIMVVRESGALSMAALEKRIEHARLLDMDDLRNEIAAAEGDCDAIDH
jgi:thioredoxin